MSEAFISKQIAKYATNKKLIEFTDKMRVPPTDFYAHIQANGDKDNEGKNINSLIGITMLDYSEGKGKKTISVDANISPDELMYVFTKLNQGIETFELSQDKIFGEADKDGKSSVTKLKIIRAIKDKNGNPRNYPWFIQIENGKGVKAQNTTGGFYMKPNTYKKQTSVFININDLDMYKLLSRVSSFISVWELTYAPQIMRDAKKIMINNTKTNYKKSRGKTEKV